MCTSTCCSGQNSSELQNAGLHPTAPPSSLGKTTERFYPVLPEHIPQTLLSTFTHLLVLRADFFGRRGTNESKTRIPLGLSIIRSKTICTTESWTADNYCSPGSSLNPGTFYAAVGKNAQYRERFKKKNRTDILLVFIKNKSQTSSLNS